jgi:hypothetical protein
MWHFKISFYVNSPADMLFGKRKLVGSSPWVSLCRGTIGVRQWWKGTTAWVDDEDINTLATIILSIEIHGPIKRSWAQQLNHQVNSFLCSSAYNIESRLLPNDLIVLRNQGEDHEGQTEHQEGAREPRRRAREGGEPIQFGIAEFESNTESRTTSYSNWHPDCIRPPFWTFYICMER